VPARDDTARWLKLFGRDDDCDVRLFCFHHAGGAASMYRRWPDLMPPLIGPIGVQLPGRADRMLERPYVAMVPLLDDLVDVMAPMFDRPFAFYGLSMGARVSWALTHRLRDQTMPMPCALFLASIAAPGLENTDNDWASDDDLVGYLRKMGGTAPEIFAAPELLAAVLPTLRADLRLVDTFRFRPATPLDVPIHVFAGVDDVEESVERMAGWSSETSARFALDIVPGGHLFDTVGVRQVIRIITDDLRPELAPAAGGPRRPTFT
jgi:medium-chain acyl-[acyl-carrier-protein] hydrolase